LEQGRVKAASRHLTIRIDGVPVLDSSVMAAMGNSISGMSLHRSRELQF